MRSEDSISGESEEKEEAGRKYVVKYSYSIVTSRPIIIFRKSIYITLCFRSLHLAS